MKSKFMKRFLIVLVILAIALGITTPQIHAETYRLTDDMSLVIDGEHDPKEAKKLAEIMNLLEDNYYRELSNDEFLDALGRGVLEMQDTPWTYYLSPEEFADMQESISGEYSGIGATVSQETDGSFKILEPVPDGPADVGGLKHGDYILKVDDVDASEFKSAVELASVVRGEEGTTVVLEIYRPTTRETLTLELTRGQIESISVSSEMLNDTTGYLYIRDFTTNLPERFAEQLVDLVSQGAKDFVFDLRHNPGGDAWALRQVVEMLLDEAEICRVEGRADGQQYVEIWASQDGKLVPDDARFMILLSRDSASASELFSGALRDSGGAVLIGEQSFGKGSGTISFNLIDDSAANITVFRYILPNGEAVEGKGLEPDYPVEFSDDQLQLSLSEIPKEEDPFIQKALELLAEDDGEDEAEDPDLDRPLDEDEALLDNEKPAAAANASEEEPANGDKRGPVKTVPIQR